MLLPFDCSQATRRNFDSAQPLESSMRLLSSPCSPKLEEYIPDSASASIDYQRETRSSVRVARISLRQRGPAGLSVPLPGRGASPARLSHATVASVPAQRKSPWQTQRFFPAVNPAWMRSLFHSFSPSARKRGMFSTSLAVRDSHAQAGRQLTLVETALASAG